MIKIQLDKILLLCKRIMKNSFQIGKGYLEDCYLRIASKRERLKVPVKVKKVTEHEETARNDKYDRD